MSVIIDDFIIEQIHQSSLKVEDFTFAENDLTQYVKAPDVAVIKGTVTVTYNPTGRTATYNNDSPSTWDYRFIDDVKAGFYTKP